MIALTHIGERVYLRGLVNTLVSGNKRIEVLHEFSKSVEAPPQKASKHANASAKMPKMARRKTNAQGL